MDHKIIEFVGGPLDGKKRLWDDRNATVVATWCGIPIFGQDFLIDHLRFDGETLYAYRKSTLKGKTVLRLVGQKEIQAEWAQNVLEDLDVTPEQMYRLYKLLGLEPE